MMAHHSLVRTKASQARADGGVAQTMFTPRSGHRCISSGVCHALLIGSGVSRGLLASESRTPEVYKAC